MASIIDYAASYKETITLENFNSVDSLIFSQLAYLNIRKFLKNNNKRVIKIKELVNYLDDPDLFQMRIPLKNKKLVTALSQNPRFKNCKIIYTEEHLSKEVGIQYLSFTVKINDEFAYISYRGTDNSIIGWKEDLSLAFEDEIPSHIASKKYFEKIDSILNMPKYIIGGHSKGGNIAVYAGVFSNVDKDKIYRIYSHDGPGFLEEIIKDKQYTFMEPRIVKMVPHDSIIGMILLDSSNIQFIKSSGVFFKQHDPFNWKINIKAQDFIDIEKPSRTNTYFNKTINEWVLGMDREERQDFFDSLFNVLFDAKIEKLSDVWRKPRQSYGPLKDVYKNLEPETQVVLVKTLKILVSKGYNNIKFKKKSKKTVKKIKVKGNKNDKETRE